jgi:pimeloyl-ACP methyl ester carboxylesterase
MNQKITPKSKHKVCDVPESEFSLGSSMMHNVHYLEWGEEDAEQTVICLHGLTRNARDFDFLAAELASNGFRVICPDMVGRGKSDWLPMPAMYGYPLYVADVMSLMAQLSLSNVHWVGTSMGGIIGMMLEAGGPMIINKLVLNDIGALVPKEGLQRLGKYVGTKTEFQTQREAEESVREHLQTFGIRHDYIWNHVFEHSIEEYKGKFRMAYDPAIGDPFKSKNADLRNMPDIDLWGIWNCLTCPTLIIRGEESDLLRKDTVKEMLKRDNKVDTHEIQNVGHAPSLMDEHQIKVVVDWLK